ncbi:MAG: hypothetical protein A2511_04865 [Deltaproteobacteria bacterium RIFOXYD12_FULL_50_9]|nr:MAG: hypothetical protein A2511_04865 [Deltaproteobacteria bacterium RIFOXYD12_FULL_50_9]
MTRKGSQFGKEGGEPGLTCPAAGFKTKAETGVTLFELLIAVLILGLVSTMIYSVLRVSINFSEKGDKQILTMEREQSFLALISRQVRCAFYNRTTQKVAIVSQDGLFTVVTRNPLIFKDVGLALAIYRFNADDQTIYYTEKPDYYNIDYNEDYVPEFSDMIPLLAAGVPVQMTYDEEGGKVLLVYGEREYELTPSCTSK